MIRYIFAACLALALACLTAVAAPARAQATTADAPAAAVALRPIWTEGQTSRYQTDTRRVTVMQIKGIGKPRKTIMDVQAKYTWQVVKADPAGGGTCRLTVDEMKVVMTDAQGKKHEVTATRAEKSLSGVQQLVKAMQNKPLTCQVASDGTISSTSGWQAIRTAAGDAGKNLSEADFIETATDLAVMPGVPASAMPGATWDKQFTWDHEVGKLSLDNTYKLLAVESIEGVPVAMVDRQSELDLTVDPKKLPDNQNVTLRVTKADAAAKIMFDMSRNEVVGQYSVRALQFQMQLRHEGRQFTQVIQQQLSTQVLRIEEE